MLLARFVLFIQMTAAPEKQKEVTVSFIDTKDVVALEHGAMLRAFSCGSLFRLTSSLRIIMMCIQDYTLRELTASQQGK